MGLIERWTCSRCGADHAGFTVCQSCRASREVATGESEVERLTRQLAGAVEAGNAMFAVLDRPDDYDRAVVDAVMEAWLNATLDRERGNRP